ncbi:MAG: hypothetical protein ACMUJM_10805 [bacterium]
MTLNKNILSWNGKVSRSLFEILINRLDRSFIKYALIDSFYNFSVNNSPYPFVERKELKPKAKHIDKEYEYQNSLLVFCYEGLLSSEHKKYIRFLSDNIVTKENLSHFLDFSLANNFNKNMRNLEDNNFNKLLFSLLSIDYGLLIQKDPNIKSRKRYILSNFHVKVDWPIAEAAEDLGRKLKYIAKDLYEKGEMYAELMQQKLFEYYGFPHTVGGRRSAAVVVSQYLANEDYLFTTYVASKESRELTKITENEISRYILIQLSNEEVIELTHVNNLSEEEFYRRYIIGKENDDLIAIFMATYKRTGYSSANLNSKIRKLNSDYRWLTVEDQFIIPLPHVDDAMCIPYSTIYI